MNPTLLLVRRGVLASKRRLVLTIVAVMLGVGFVSGSFVLRDSLRSVFGDLAADINAGVDVQVRTQVAFGQPGSGSPVPADLVETVRAVDGVTNAVGTVGNVPVTIVGVDGKAKTPQGAPTFGIAWSAELPGTSLTLVEGRAPKGAGEVLLDLRAADQTGYQVGEEMTVVVPDGKRRFTLTGTFRFGENNSIAGAFLVAFDEDVASGVLGLGGDFGTIDVQGSDRVTDDELAKRVSVVLPDGFEAVTHDQVVEETEDTFGGFIDGFAIALLVFAGIALFVSAFIINNTFAILASQRLREMALLRAIGASSAQVRTILLAEALLVGSFASVLGLGFGVLIALGIKALIGALAGSIPGGLVFTPTPIVVGLAVGVLVTALSAITPAARAARIPPIAAMSGVHSLALDHAGRRLAVALGATLSGATLTVVGLFVRPGSTARWLSLAGIGAMVLFLGAAGLSRVIVGPAVRAISAVLRPITRVLTAPWNRVRHRPYQRVIGLMAREHAARSPRRTAAAAAALMIGLALVAAGSVVAASIKQTFRDQLERSVTADLFFQDQSFVGVPASITERISAIDGIAAVSGVRIAPIQVDGDTKAVAAVDHAHFGDLVDIELRDGEWADLTADRLFIHVDPARDLDLEVGDIVDIEFPSTGVQPLTVAGIYEDSAVAGNWLIDIATYEANFDGPQFSFDFLVAARIESGADLGTVKDDAKTFLIDAAPQIEVRDLAEFRRSQEQQMDVLLAVVNALLGLAVFIALIGIANTLALSVHERTRELGLMRAVGMRRNQTRSLVRWESVLTAVFGAASGLILGVILGTAVAVALPASVVRGVAIPVVQLIGYVLLAVLAGTLAARSPARRAAKMDVLDAIAHY